MYQLKSKFINPEKALMQIPFNKEKRNRRKQLQQVYCEIIYGNLSEFRQEQAYGKCEK
jgi:hypothetical protein